MVYDGLQSSFVSLAWPWSGRSLPKGEPVGVLGPWTGAQCGQVPCPPATNYLTTQRLTGWYLVTWLVGWPVAAGKLAGWLPIEQNVNLTLPKAETSCGQVFDYFGHLDLWSNVPPLETSHSQVCYYFRQNDLWLDVPPSRDILWPSVLWLWSDWHLVTCTPTQRSGFGSGSHLVRLLVMLTCGQMYPTKTSGGQVWYHIRSLQWKTSFCLYLLRQLNWSHIWAHIILCKKPKTEKVMWTWKDDWPPGWLLHHKRPFTWEGNYLVAICN